MRTIVRFDAPGGAYAAFVEHVREVAPSEGVVPLPAPRPGVSGLIRRGDDALAVLTVLSTEGRHILVLDDGLVRFGLLVERVTGVDEIDERGIGEAPAGQEGEIVKGVLQGDQGMVLLLDVFALAGRLVG